jgi:hypothetical protein
VQGFDDESSQPANSAPDGFDRLLP